MGVTVAGIAGMSLAIERVVLLQAGQSTESAGYTWALQAVRDEPGPNYAERVATVQVSRNGKVTALLEPARRSFPVQRMTTTEAAITPPALPTSTSCWARNGMAAPCCGCITTRWRPGSGWVRW